jgi:hypothetical protein
MRHKQTCFAVSIILVLLSFLLISLVNKEMFYTSIGLYGKCIYWLMFTLDVNKSVS